MCQSLSLSLSFWNHADGHVAVTNATGHNIGGIDHVNMQSEYAPSRLFPRIESAAASNSILDLDLLLGFSIRFCDGTREEEKNHWLEKEEEEDLSVETLIGRQLIGEGENGEGYK